ncbi:hypothetical protein BDN70DRAFT_937648 [Pholiota conissans]|uniref:F-box domain-containing protein n=1 Tax=Pholiota conissans TaxID=109636 RepID=A0A9P6CN63_9AGAR|nr:hypothetical protein BDN70DRAFT_937648 [Pholiota conissans]
MDNAPLDIVETILDLLAQDDLYLRFTKVCSLVCQDFHAICKKRIFASIALNTPSSCTVVKPLPSNPRHIERGTTPQFVRLLQDSPDIGEYVHRLQYSIASNDLDNRTLIQTFQKVTRLRSFEIGSMEGISFDWSNNPLREWILHLLHLPTLEIFGVLDFFMQNFNLSDLAPCYRLESLNLNSVQIVPRSPCMFPISSIKLRALEIGYRAAGSTLVSLCGAKCADDTPFMDFTNLTHITVAMTGSPGFFGLAQCLLSRCDQLVQVHLRIDSQYCNFMLRGLTKMLAPSMSTLTHLTFFIAFGGLERGRLLRNISDELRQMNNKNIIEKIGIEVALANKFNADCSQAKQWAHLNDALGGSGWPNLREVAVTISIFARIVSEEHPGLADAVQSLPEMKLPRLLSRKLVSFKIAMRDD